MRTIVLQTDRSSSILKTINLIRYTQDITLQLVNRKTRNITIPHGIWTKSVIFFNESDPEAGLDEQRSTFISDHAQIQEPGDYHAFLLYGGCRQEPCRVNFDLENCPGVIEECAQDPIRILACASNPRSQLARIRFTGVNNPFLFKNERVGKTVKYYINSSQRMGWENGSLPGESFEQIDKNTYEVSFPLLKDETVYDSSMNYLHIILIILRRTPRTQHSHSRCKMMKKMNWSKQELWHHRNCKNKKQPCFLIPEKERSMLSRKISNSRHGNRLQHQLLKRLKQMLDCQE